MRWLIHTIKKNKVAFSLLAIVAANFIYGVMLSRGLLSNDNAVLLSGEEGFPMNWHLWFIKNYVIGLILIFLVLRNKLSEIDKDAVIAWIVFDVLGFFSYLWRGWPEPFNEIILGFLLSLFIFVALRITKLNRDGRS